MSQDGTPREATQTGRPAGPTEVADTPGGAASPTEVADIAGVAAPADPAEEVLWHLAERHHWERALRTGHYDRSTRGASFAEVGFLHASHPPQLPAVARQVYAGLDDLLVLEIDRAALAVAGIEVREEPGDPDDPSAERFPHLYAPLPVVAVTRVRPARVERGWLELGPWQARAPEPAEGR